MSENSEGEGRPFRILPQVTPENEHFWTGGAQGELRFLACEACATLVHPPAPVCPACLGRELAPRAVSGRARVLTWTENHQPWIPGFDPPYLIAIVELEAQSGLRLMTNLVDCGPGDVEIGMPVEVRFEERDEGIFIPLFAPVAT
ncbi:MAG: Zn-ribbon domain-containing OB-fold protein [Myxococcota bacterium]